MTCETCDQHGGFKGDPPTVAEFVLTVTNPPGAAEENPAELLCSTHAVINAQAYLGFGWTFKVQYAEEWLMMQRCCQQHTRQFGVTNPTICRCGRTLVVRDREWQVWVSSLVDRGTNTAPTGG